jgi:hypothetical protein
MQFQAMDVVLPANHSLVLQLETTGLDYMEPAVNTPVEIHTTEDSMLTLPVEDPTDDEFFFPPGHGDELGDGIPPDADGDPSTAFGDES